MKEYTNPELAELIFQTNEEFAGESLFLLIQEACRRKLTITFKENEVVYNRSRS